VWFEIDYLQVAINADVNPVEKASQACYPEAGEVRRAERDGCLPFVARAGERDINVERDYPGPTDDMRRPRFDPGEVHAEWFRYRRWQPDTECSAIDEAAQGSLVDAVDRDIGHRACNRVPARHGQLSESNCEYHAQFASPARSSSGSAGTRKTASALVPFSRSHARTSAKLSPSVSTWSRCRATQRFW
jgi:hypothetical protein